MLPEYDAKFGGAKGLAKALGVDIEQGIKDDAKEFENRKYNTQNAPILDYYQHQKCLRRFLCTCTRAY